MADLRVDRNNTPTCCLPPDTAEKKSHKQPVVSTHGGNGGTRCLQLRPRYRSDGPQLGTAPHVSKATTSPSQRSANLLWFLSLGTSEKLLPPPSATVPSPCLQPTPLIATRARTGCKYLCEFPGTAVRSAQRPGHPSSPSPGDQTSEVRCPRAELPAEAPGEGPSCLFQLLGAPGVHPWAGGRLPPVSASASTWLLLCVHVSPLPCLIRTVSLGFRATPIQEDPHLRPFTASPLQTPYFLKSCLQTLGEETH